MAKWNVRTDRGLKTWGHAAIHVPERKAVYSFGGCPFHGKDKIEIHVLDTDSYSWRTVPVANVGTPQSKYTPTARAHHTVVKDQNCAYIWGGSDGQDAIDNTLWCFDFEKEQWSYVKYKSKLIPRWGHSACIIHERMVVFGGTTQGSGNTVNDILFMNLQDRSWKPIPQDTAVIPPRVGHTASVIGDMMYIIGGTDGGELIDQNKYVQIYDASKNRWNTPDVTGHVKPRTWHSAVVFKEDIFIIGGYTNDGVSRDIYIFHSGPCIRTMNYEYHIYGKYGSQQWDILALPGTPMPPSDDHASITVGTSILIFGGKSGHFEAYSDLAVLDLISEQMAELTKLPTVREQMAELTMSEMNVVACTRQFFEEHREMSYPMDGPSKGAVLIINMREVKIGETGELLPRSGSTEDRRCMADLFKDLGFSVKIYEDVSLQQFSKAMKTFVGEAIDMQAPSVFVVLMSHGGTRGGSPYILTNDGYKVQVRETIEEHFSSVSAPELAHRPKVVILESCQGDRIDKGVDLERPMMAEEDSFQHRSTGKAKAKKVAEFCNYYLAFATQPRRPAMRVVGEGSWFIMEINEVFRKKAATKHFTELMAEVRFNVSSKYGTKEGFFQSPEAVDGLNKAFYLFPGIQQEHK